MSPEEVEAKFDEAMAAGEPVMVVGLGATSVAIDGYDAVNNAQAELLADEQPPTRGAGWCAPSP